MRANIGADLEQYLEPAPFLASTGDIVTAAVRRHAARREGPSREDPA
jgi:hypothetical protein